MKYIISGTNRPGSRSLQVSRKVQEAYQSLGEEVSIIDLCEMPMAEVNGGQYSKDRPAGLQKVVDNILESEGLIFVVPEYNGSYPGILKYFIDHWGFPDAFEYRPCCFIGLGGQYGALRPVEHLQQVMGYRNAFLYPKRIFLHNVWTAIDAEGEFTDEATMPRVVEQAKGFSKFVKALESEGLDANHFLKTKNT